MPVTEVNGTKINYSQLSHKGDGKTRELVMVHGLAANMAFWLADYAKHFSQNFRVTLIDMRGHGRSKVTESGYSPENLGRDLQGVLDALEIQKAHIIAHSFGGVVAMNFAFNNPRRVESLILADTQINAGRALLKTNGWISANPLKEALKACNINIDTKHPYFGYHFITEVAKMRANEAEIPEILYPWVKRIFEGNSKRTAKQWLELMENTQALAELTANDNLSATNLYKIKCPILAIFGEKSHSMATASYMRTLWDNANFVSISNAGHFFPKSFFGITKDLCDTFLSQESLDSVICKNSNVNYIYDDEFLNSACG